MSFNDRVRHRITRSELERRWKLLRGHMRSRGLEALIALNFEDKLGGYVKWLTDVPAFAFMRVVIFHADDLMTIVDHGPTGGARTFDGSDIDNLGVGEIRTTAGFPSVHYTARYEAEIVCDVLSKRGYKKIGLVGPDFMPSGFVQLVRARMESRAELIDVTEPVDKIKAVKSAEELELIRQTAEMQDKVFQRVLLSIKPGMRCSDVAALASYEGRLLGSEQGIFLCGSAKLGRPVPHDPCHFQARVLEKGDHLRLLVENNGAAGFYTEVSRTIVLGKATAELLEGFQTAVEAQANTLRYCKPKTECRAIYAAHARFMKERGLPMDLRLYAHGQGYDLVERPLIRADEEMTLEEGMCLAVHPGYATTSYFAGVCDNYIVFADGPGPCLHGTEKRVFEI